MQGLGIPSFGQASGTGVRKQRSQRFTVPSHQPGRTRSGDQPSGGDYDSNSTSSSTAAPPVPSLPYMPPPPPVQSLVSPPPPHLHQHHQLVHHYPPPDSYSSGPSPPVDPTSHLSLEFLASPTGMSPYPGPAFTSSQAQAQAPPSSGGPAPGNVSSPLSAGGGATADSGSDEIIETAIVIKSIPFACPKEHLLAVMASLSLPPPFAFNYHFAPEDPTSFRGLAFANYRSPSEAAVVRAAMDGLEIMGRKLRAEFKKQLRPGEKEMIERTKAIKRMRSAQMLATGGTSLGGGGDRERGGGGGGNGGGGWNNRREASDGARTFGQREFVPAAAAGVPPPVPAIPPYYQQHHPQQPPPPHHYLGSQQQQPPPHAPPLPCSYPFQRPPPPQYGYPNGNAGHHHHHHQHHGSISASSSQDPPSVAPTASSFGISGETSDLQQHHHGLGEGGGTTTSSEVSDVGTSVSQRVPTRRSSDGDESAAGSSQVGAGREELDMNDPTTLELYSRVLLFSSDSLRDELAFSRSLSTPQRRTVHLIAQKLGLDHRSVGTGERRCVVVYKRGCAPPLGAGVDADGRQRVPQTEPPRRLAG
ncbi:hypothetical protein BMF94_3978 [Rhodotorula taiwanensis]|uniref:R3H domain-containing protein n=1 Tax=Rhodotorula taiwanensis TaxID=741276 RepID=A0A2S5B889_9BASI|nr:hypothetical protein BMF94_3978 [Rhodotorula taiwanensis]